MRPGLPSCTLLRVNLSGWHVRSQAVKAKQRYTQTSRTPPRGSVHMSLKLPKWSPQLLHAASGAAACAGTAVIVSGADNDVCCWRTMVISAAAAAVMGIVGTEILQYAKEKAQRLEDEKQRLAIKVDLDKLAVPPGHVEVTPDLLRLGFTGKGHFVKRQRRNKDREADKDLPPVPKWAYTGDIENGRRSGQGVSRTATGTAYFGHWRNDMFHGKGALSYPNGDRYEGDFVNGRFHGHGQYFGSGGWTYRGMWVDGQRQGYGSYASVESSTYDGEWVADFRQGKGVMYFAVTNATLSAQAGAILVEKPATCDCILECDWLGGLPHGKAMLQMPSGAVAVGMVEQGVWDGDVTVTQPTQKRDGTVERDAPTDQRFVACPAAAYAPCTPSCLLCGGAGKVATTTTAQHVWPPADGLRTTESYWKGQRVQHPGEKKPGSTSEAQATLTTARRIVTDAV